VAYLLLVLPITSKLDAITVTISEVALFLLFTLTICFQFDIPPIVSSVMETTAIICIFTAIFVPSISGGLSLVLKIREMLKHYARMNYAIRASRFESGIESLGPLASPTRLIIRRSTPLAY